jgi:hypothetical protein
MSKTLTPAQTDSQCGEHTPAAQQFKVILAKLIPSKFMHAEKQSKQSFDTGQILEQGASGLVRGGARQCVCKTARTRARRRRGYRRAHAVGCNKMSC